MSNRLLEQFPEELLASLPLDASYRADQIFQWIHRGASSFSEMTNLPKSLQSALQESAGPIRLGRIEQKQTDPQDGSEKITVSFQDDTVVESVLLIDGKGRKTACVSSQAGCAMGCAFCRTASMGLKRSLTASEIIEQFLLLKSSHPDITHIVFMGMGEPLANLPEVRRAVSIFHHRKAHNISCRRITLSTCGLPRAVKDLGENGPPIRLAVSLVTAREDLRDMLMPVNRTYPLAILKEALEAYQQNSGKRITIEYVLIRGCNDTDTDIRLLAEFCSRIQVLINLIPWNPCPELPFEEPSRSEAESFARKLENQGLSVSKRLRKGRGVSGACGQLAVKQTPGSRQGS